MKISREGVDVKKASYKDLLFSTQFDTLKILKTGTLSIDLPEEVLNSGATATSTHSVSYEHNLDYIPMFLPLFGGVGYATLTRGVDDTSDFIVNDSAEWEIPPGSYSPSEYNEVATIYVTTTEIVLQIYRYNTLPVNQTFGEHTAEAYYTLFYNNMSNEMDLL